MKSFFFMALALMTASSHAHGHFGHVGELAGHGHLIEIGILIAGVVLAAAIASRKSDKTDEETQDDAQKETGKQTA